MSEDYAVPRIEPADRRTWDQIGTVVRYAEWVGEGLDLAALTAEDALRMLHRLREATTALAEIDAVLSRHIYLSGEHGDVRLDGLPAARVVRGRDRKNWDGRGAAFAYVDRQLASSDGEVPDPAAVVAWVLEVVGVGYCRTTALKAAGLDPESYCDSAPGKVRVEFVT